MPEKCPACGEENTRTGTVTLRPDVNMAIQECPAKAIKAFTLFGQRDVMNIEGLFGSHLRKWIARGF